ncbi:proline-rich protein 29 isoform X1 [Paroedura picta]|uniref:proline-rich protein 29 isoform X1 n=1 Tax=Paroedura picta TaxID=143630 RepID=UPI004056004E
MRFLPCCSSNLLHWGCLGLCYGSGVSWRSRGDARRGLTTSSLHSATSCPTARGDNSSADALDPLFCSSGQQRRPNQGSLPLAFFLSFALSFGADLMEMMMIQNTQMHQVIMNKLAMAAAACFGLSSAQSSAQVPHFPWQVEDDEDAEPETLVFHHHYPSCPNAVPFRDWRSLPRASAWPQPTIRHVGPDPQPAVTQDGPVVPPPPPPSATGTVTADVPPASEYYDFTQGRF